MPKASRDSSLGTLAEIMNAAFPFLLLAASSGGVDNEAIPPKFWLILILFCLIISMYCLLQINFRFRRYPAMYRVLWSAVVLLPLCGPFLYGALFHELERSSGTDENAGGWGIDGSSHGHGPDCDGSDSGGGGGGD